MSLLLVIVLSGLFSQVVAKKGSSSPPAGFVYLHDVAPTIVQDMRYAVSNNFTGHVLPGYQAGECILRTEVAYALSRVQTSLKPMGYSLKTYDCYRPARAVRSFGDWAHDLTDSASKDYYPRLAKTRLFGKGYIARRSSHSKGVAVDLTLVRLPAIAQPDHDPTLRRASCIAPLDERPFDTSIDMGTAFDCFDVRSHTNHRAINKQARANRQRLKSIMRRFGFANYHREWWHYSYRKRRYPRVYHDFPILPRKEPVKMRPATK